MPIRTLKISTTDLNFRINIPTTTTLIRNEGQTIMFRNLLHEHGVCLDGLQPIRDG